MIGRIIPQFTSDGLQSQYVDLTYNYGLCEDHQDLSTPICATDLQASFQDQLTHMAQCNYNQNNNVGFVAGKVLRSLFDKVLYTFTGKPIEDAEASVPESQINCLQPDNDLLAQWGVASDPMRNLATAIAKQDFRCINILGQSTDLNLPDINGNYPLAQAIDTDNAAVVMQLVKLGADVNGPAGGGFVPLLHAVKNNKVASFKQLVESGADLYRRDYLNDANQYHFNPDSIMPIWMHIVLKYAHTQAAEFLIERISVSEILNTEAYYYPNHPFSTKTQILNALIYTNYGKAVLGKLKAADVKANDLPKDGMEALLSACLHGVDTGDVSVVSDLLSMGIHVLHPHAFSNPAKISFIESVFKWPYEYYEHAWDKRSNLKKITLELIRPLTKAQSVELMLEYYDRKIFSLDEIKSHLGDSPLKASDMPHKGVKALFSAIKDADFSRVQFLLDLGVDANEVFNKNHQEHNELIRIMRNNEKLKSLLQNHVITNLYKLPATRKFESLLELDFLQEQTRLTILMEMKAAGLKCSDFTGKCTKALFKAIEREDVLAVKALLELGVDLHIRYKDTNHDGTLYQFALVSDKSIRKLVKRYSVNSNFSSNTKNSFTIQFEDIIRKIIENKDRVEYSRQINAYGNVHYDPIIDGITYPLSDIIYKMDWRQVSFDESLYVGKGVLFGNIDRYVGGHSLTMNAFLKGEEHLFLVVRPEYITSLWLDNAFLAHELNRISMVDTKMRMDSDLLVCRGQSFEDTMVRGHEISFISTSNNLDICSQYNRADMPIIIFENNSGTDITDYYHGNSQLLFLPRMISQYELFTFNGIEYALVKNIDNNYENSNNDIEIELTSQAYSQKFESIIGTIVSGDKAISTVKGMNQYGAIYYDVVIDGEKVDLYDVISHMDWSSLQLSNATLAAFDQSKYRLWDHQQYTNHYTAIPSAKTQDTPLSLTELSSNNQLIDREEVPRVCHDQPCDYGSLYEDLTDIEKGLIFQYTSASNKALNAFLKGNIQEFNANIEAHTSRWGLDRRVADSETFDIKDPLQWWVYAARVTHALNKIKSRSTPEPVCRGQSHKDRHVRIQHPSFISATPDKELCKSYAQGEIIEIEKFEGKDITGLSFHPAQKELLHPPAFLRNYRKSEAQISNVRTMRATVAKGKHMPASSA